MIKPATKDRFRRFRDDRDHFVAFAQIGDVQDEMSCLHETLMRSLHNRSQETVKPRIESSSVFYPRLLGGLRVPLPVKIRRGCKDKRHLRSIERLGCRDVQFSIKSDRSREFTVPFYGPFFHVRTNITYTSREGSEQSPAVSAARIPHTISWPAVPFVDELGDGRTKNPGRSATKGDGTQYTMRFDRISVLELESDRLSQSKRVMPGEEGRATSFGHRFISIWKERVTSSETRTTAWLNYVIAKKALLFAKLSDLTFDILRREHLGVGKRLFPKMLKSNLFLSLQDRRSFRPFLCLLSSDDDITTHDHLSDLIFSIQEDVGVLVEQRDDLFSRITTCTDNGAPFIELDVQISESLSRQKAAKRLQKGHLSGKTNNRVDVAVRLDRCDPPISVDGSTPEISRIHEILMGRNRTFRCESSRCERLAQPRRSHVKVNTRSCRHTRSSLTRRCITARGTEGNSVRGTKEISKFLKVLEINRREPDVDRRSTSRCSIFSWLLNHVLMNITICPQETHPVETGRCEFIKRSVVDVTRSLLSDRENHTSGLRHLEGGLFADTYFIGRFLKCVPLVSTKDNHTLFLLFRNNRIHLMCGLAHHNAESMKRVPNRHTIDMFSRNEILGDGLAGFPSKVATKDFGILLGIESTFRHGGSQKYVLGHDIYQVQNRVSTKSYRYMAPQKVLNVTPQTEIHA